MDSKEGYLVNGVECPSCKQLHDLFIDLEAEPPPAMRFTCPHTGNVATWLCDKAVHLVKGKPNGCIHAIRHTD